MVSHSGLLTVMERAVRKAGSKLRRDFGEVEHLQVSRKGPADFVSLADKRCEETLVEELQRARPDWGFLLEEGGVIEGDPTKPRWIIDPLDGTTNFLHGIPIFSISVALERQGQLVAAVIYNPAMDELYTAERGGGAFMNDRRLRAAIAYMRQHVHEPMAVEDVASRVGLSRGHFFALFRDQLNTTPQVFWSAVRVEEAVRLLAHQKQPLTSVALDLGFSTPGNFSRFFREHMGVSPSRFRRAATGPAQHLLTGVD